MSVSMMSSSACCVWLEVDASTHVESCFMSVLDHYSGEALEF